MTNKASSTIMETPRVWTPEAEWEIPRAQGAFLFPAFGPNTYNEVVKQVLGNGQKLPTGEQSAFMLDEAYNSQDEAIKNSPRTKFVRDDIIRNGWLWVPQVNLTTPNSAQNPGMYSVFDVNGEGLSREYTTEELEERLQGGETWKGVRFSPDGDVAFAPQDTIRSGYHEKGTLAQDGAYLAVYGPKGAEALDRVAGQFRGKPYSWNVSHNSTENVQTLSVLDRVWFLGGGRLDADFGDDGSGRNGYVLSVSGSKNVANGDAPKN